MNAITCTFKIKSGAEHRFEVDIERLARTLKSWRELPHGV